MVSSIEVNHKSVESAKKGEEVCIKVESVGSEAPRLYGRHFDHTDLLVSKVSSCTIVIIQTIECPRSCHRSAESQLTL